VGRYAHDKFDAERDAIDHGPERTIRLEELPQGIGSPEHKKGIEEAVETRQKLNEAARLLNIPFADLTSSIADLIAHSPGKTVAEIFKQWKIPFPAVGNTFELDGKNHTISRFLDDGEIVYAPSTKREMTKEEFRDLTTPKATQPEDEIPAGTAGQ